MKNLLFFICLLVTYVASAQDVTHTMTRTAWDRDTLSVTTRDTIDFNIPNRIAYNYNAYVICAQTTTGTDTIYVKKLGADGVMWVPAYLIDESTDGLVSSIIVTTTPKEYYLMGSFPAKLRLYSVDVGLSCIVLVSAQSVY
jgi:hypothetical protein